MKIFVWPPLYTLHIMSIPFLAAFVRLYIVVFPTSHAYDILVTLSLREKVTVKVYNRLGLTGTLRCDRGIWDIDGGVLYLFVWL